MNSNEENLKIEENNPSELKVGGKRESANQNNQYSLEIDNQEQFDVIEIEDENEYLQKKASGTVHQQQDL